MDIMRWIERHDPDGNPRATEETYAEFRAWVIREYGADTLEAYESAGI